MNKSEYNSKIFIVDDEEIRRKLVDVIEDQSKILVSKWAIKNALRIFNLIGYDFNSDDFIKRGIEYNKKCNDKLISVNELRTIGFEIHRHAKKQGNEIIKLALRAFGHAISTAHMKNHAIVSSDYTIKVFNLLYENNFEIALKERLTQLEELNNLILQE